MVMRRNGHERRNDGEGRAEVFHLHGAVRGREGLYTGFTVDDVHRRVAVHNSGKGARYTRSRLPVVLAWYREWGREHEARSMEYRLKRMKKEEKEAMAASFGEEKT